MDMVRLHGDGKDESDDGMTLWNELLHFTRHNYFLGIKSLMFHQHTSSITQKDIVILFSGCGGQNTLTTSLKNGSMSQTGPSQLPCDSLMTIVG
jgi:hypothetical protein